ncbi:MAG: hypothetical protein NT107_08295 [Planctomycetota bacterium]|nr:hypothetical protein [Planctomycetota bacterium]
MHRSLQTIALLAIFGPVIAQTEAVATKSEKTEKVWQLESTSLGG